MANQHLFARLKKGLSKTSRSLTEGLGTVILGKKQIDNELLAALEDRLLLADVGFEATTKIMSQLTDRMRRRELSDIDALFKALENAIIDILAPCSVPLMLGNIKPFCLLVVGVNGAGKTTTIGKIAHRLKEHRKSVLLAAGDTFRAAAIEQLQAWGHKNDVPVIAQGTGADSAAVIFDAMQSAIARNVDVLIADTAGRLHTQQNLMEELKKIKRVVQKLDPQAPHEILLVVEAGTGQNAIKQALEFHQTLNLTGICVTKLDGTAKGGVLIAIADKLKLPIRYIGVGESSEDLRIFNAQEFARALLNREQLAQ